MCVTLQPQAIRAIFTKGIKIYKFNGWLMELADYNVKFLHIHGKHNILGDAILRLKMLNIYKEPLENPKIQIVNNTKQVVTEVCPTSMHTIGMIHSAVNKSMTKHAKCCITNTP